MLYFRRWQKYPQSMGFGPTNKPELQEFAKRATTQRPALWRHSARTHAVVTSQKVHTHSCFSDVTYLSVINSVSGIELCEFAFFDRFDSPFIGRTSSFLCELSSRSESIDSFLSKVLRPVTSTQVFLGFPVSKSKCWDGSQDSKLPLNASHVALPT